MERSVLGLTLVGMVLFFVSCEALQPHAVVILGNYEFNRGEYEEANRAYLSGVDASFDGWFSYNLANVYSALGEKEAALVGWEAALEPEDESLAFRALFNRGITEYELGLYDAAAVHFREALILNPSHTGAKHNMELVLRKLSARGTESSAGSPADPTQEPGDEVRRVLDYIAKREHLYWRSAPVDQETQENDW